MGDVDATSAGSDRRHPEAGLQLHAQRFEGQLRTVVEGRRQAAAVGIGRDATGSLMVTPAPSATRYRASSELKRIIPLLAEIDAAFESVREHRGFDFHVPIFAASGQLGLLASLSRTWLGAQPICPSALAGFTVMPSGRESSTRLEQRSRKPVGIIALRNFRGSPPGGRLAGGPSRRRNLQIGLEIHLVAAGDHEGIPARDRDQNLRF